MNQSCKQIFGLTGLVNTGTICYMNSAIQTLCHIYPLTSYLFSHEESIYQILKRNARKNLKDTIPFQLDRPSRISIELRKKIQDPSFKAEMLTPDEETIVFNHTITVHLIKLLKAMWKENCIILPTSFRNIFTDVNTLFYGYEQQDSEEAYSCIIQKIHEELSEVQPVNIKISTPSVLEFMKFKDDITKRINEASNADVKARLQLEYKHKKMSMPAESLTIEACNEMQSYYGSTYNNVTKLFTGFFHLYTKCTQEGCKKISNKYEPFFLIQLPMPDKFSFNASIETCIEDYCKEEILDDKNKWFCDECNKHVNAAKKLQIWTAPTILVIHIKRFHPISHSKDSRQITYPIDDLDISNVISPYQLDRSKCYNYSLQSVISHTGTRNHGHYFAYCRYNNTDKWFSYNDDDVKEISKESIVTPHAYILYYINKRVNNIN